MTTVLDHNFARSENIRSRIVQFVGANEATAVVVLTVAGGALRFFHLGYQSLWLDELFSVAVAHRDWMQVIVGSLQGDTNPPLFNLLLHLALQLGSDETAARAISVIFSIATIPLFYLLARDLFDAQVALLATILLVINPFQLLFAQEARMYAQFGFLSLAAGFFFLRGLESGRRTDWVLFDIAEALAFYTHSLAFLNLLALDIFAATRRRSWSGLILGHGILGILFAPWLVVFVGQAARVQAGFWGTAPMPTVLLTTPYLFMFSNVLPAVLVPPALFVALALLALALIAAGKSLAAHSVYASGLAFALVSCLIPLLLLFAISQVRPMFVERTLLPSSFGLYIVIAWAIRRAQPRMLNLALGSAAILLAVIGVANYYTNPLVQKPPMREAAAVVAASFQPGDLVVHTSDSSALAFQYYAPALPNIYLAGDPDYVAETTRGRTGRIAGLEPKELEGAVAGYGRVWLVVALDHNVDYQLGRVREMDGTFTRLSQRSVGGIDLLLYEPRRR